MAKYIKLDDLLSLITTLRNHRLLGKSGGAEAWKMAKALPAADVEPVRHGWWMPHRYGVGETVMTCSVCGRHITVNTKTEDVKDYPYCHCGAKMDE